MDRLSHMMGFEALKANPCLPSHGNSGAVDENQCPPTVT